VRALELIKNFDPDIIISVQTVASATVSLLRKRGQYKKLFGIAFSDFHIHKFWIYDQADFYFVNIAEQKKEMMELGMMGSKIFVIGMGLKPKTDYDSKEVKASLGIDINRKIILMASGSMGTGISGKNLVFLAKGILNELAQLNTPAQVIIVCGKRTKILSFI
jgi:processive 1,2-diacylglycerol beta-glucosyltransferase